MWLHGRQEPTKWKSLHQSIYQILFVTDVMTKNILFYPHYIWFCLGSTNMATLSISFPNVGTNRRAKYAIHCCCASFTKRHPSIGQKDIIYHSDINNQVLLHAHFYNPITENQKMIWSIWSSKHSVLSNLLWEVRSWKDGAMDSSLLWGNARKILCFSIPQIPADVQSMYAATLLPWLQ